MNILFYGDSNTFGTNPKDGTRHPRDVRFTGILQKELGDDYYIIEEGLSSRTTAFDDPVFPGKNGLKYLLPCLDSHRPLDLVVFMLGTNDAKERFNANPHYITLGMELLIKTALTAEKAFGDSKNVLLICPCAILDGITELMPALGAGIEQRTRDLIPLYRELAKKLNIHFMAADDYASASTIDKVHLDEKSHRQLATAIKEKILEIEKTL